MNRLWLCLARTIRRRIVLQPLAIAAALFGSAWQGASADEPQKVPLAMFADFLPARLPVEERIAAELDDSTDFAFNETPLTDCVVFFSDLHNISIIIDSEALKERAIALDVPLTRTLNGIKLKNALRILLHPLKLTYFIEDEVLKITTQERAERSFTTRVYPVFDLCTVVGDVQQLVIAIRKTVATNWEPEETTRDSRSNPLLTSQGLGPATKAPEPKNIMPVSARIIALEPIGCLVVTQTYDGHDHVLQLLQTLRSVKVLGPGKQTTPVSAAKGAGSAPGQGQAPDSVGGR